jgi:RNA polymerase sigma-70 factor (ECF subfamily)
MTSDLELATAFRDGDERAFAALFERFRRPLYVFALRMLGDADAARDLVQDVFVRVWERRGQLDRPESFRSWLFAVARNRCLSLLRRDRGHVALDEAPEESLAVAAAGDGPERDQDLALLRRALAGLKVEYREVLVLREYQELSYAEIAQITESTESAVKSRLFKARRALHGTLAGASNQGR